MFVVVFFKQKTAYEMRISDWSSDVCSSDLGQPGRRDGDAGGRGRGRLARRLTAPADGAERCRRRGGGALPRLLPEDRLRSRSARRCRFGDLRGVADHAGRRRGGTAARRRAEPPRSAASPLHRRAALAPRKRDHRVEVGGVARRQVAEGDADQRRSEEQKTEPETQMRNSYAVFCLKKKRTKKRQTTTRPGTIAK